MATTQPIERMPPINRDRIAAEALAILDRHGVDGFSMRAVAGRLGVTPMALYHHVRNKAELARLVVEAVSREHPLAPPVECWQENIWMIASWMRQCALAHPAAIELRRLFRIWSEDFHAMADRWMTSWQRSGLDPQRALLGATASSAAIWGLVHDELYVRGRVSAEIEVPSAPNARLLLTAAPDPDELFETGVRAILEGLHARLLRQQSSA